MKNTINVKLVRVLGIIAFVAVFTLSTAACFIQSGGGKKINSPETLKEYLDSQSANSPDKPIKISMGADEFMIPKIAAILKETDKYVYLNLTSNALTKIPKDSFKECKTLVGITITNSVTDIGEAAFDRCANLTSVTIGNSVTIIGWGAFSRCTNLTSVTIPNSVTSIRGEAFYSCTNLSSIIIPNSVTSIGDWAFNDTAWFNNQPDGVVYAVNIALGYKGKDDMPENTSIVILEGTKKIADYAFVLCTNLVNVTIPNSVTCIGNAAFLNCTGLTNVTIPDSVTSIGGSAFYGCISLTSVTFQGTITSENLKSWHGSDGEETTPFDGDLRDKYLAGGVGTYTTTTELFKQWYFISWEPVWTKK